MTSAEKDCACPRSRHQHGTRGGYMRDGCRCFPCRLANSRIDGRGRNGGGYADPGILIPRSGTLRRLQALHAVGWSQSDLAAELGVTKQAINDLSNHATDVVLAATAETITRLYDRLWDKRPPNRYRQRTVNWARRRGFAPPMAWDDDTIDDPTARPVTASGPVMDEVAIDRALGGELLPLTKAERDEVARRFTAAGVSARDIADRLGTTQRTISRRRAADRKEAAA